MSFAALAAFLGGVQCVAPAGGESVGSSRDELVRDPRVHPASAGSTVDVATWVQATPATSPPSRVYHAMAYDRARQRVVLFGGESTPQGRALGDTWEWDGSTWTNRTAASGDPPARADHALAYDVARARTVLFGGATADTWEWDGATWQARTPAKSPPALFFFPMAYDVARARTVLFGGESAAGALSSATWEWDGSTWSETFAGPFASSEGVLAYDPGLGHVVMAGGVGPTQSGPFPILPHGTWDYDGTEWTALSDSNGLSATVWMTYDAALERLIGGESSFGINADRVFTWEGTAWKEAVEPAAAPKGGVAVYDEARDKVVLFVHDQTWLLTLTPTAVGTSCASDGDCTSGHCVDKLCCATACDGQCEACNVASHEGVCTAATGAPVGARAACAGSGVCGGQCDGVHRTACTYPPAQTTCGAAACAAGVATAASFCDGAGACVAGATTACGAYACGATSCNKQCATSADCGAGDVCFTGGVCGPPLDLGTTCASDGDCASVHCVDHVCCDTACSGQCEACNVQTHAGRCTAVTGAPVAGRAACEGSGVCAGQCDGAQRNACTFPSSAVLCRGATCAAGTATAAAYCDGAGACPASATMSCAPFACGATACEDGGAPDAGVDGSSDASTDAAPGDGGEPEAGPSDSGATDSGVTDGGAPDSGVTDSGVQDGGAPDSGVLDSGAPDSGAPDSEARDGSVDAGLPDARAPNDAAPPIADAASDGASDADGGPAAVTPASGDAGCNCRASGAPTSGGPTGLLSASALVVLLRRKRRRA